MGIAVDSSGNVYIADMQNRRIRKVTAATGRIDTVVGGGQALEGSVGDGGPATSAVLFGPQGVALDTSGNLYVADTGHNRVRKISATGTITTIAGDGSNGFSGDGWPATAASLGPPEAVAVDGAGNVYIADYTNARVRRVDAMTGNITTLAGNGVRGFSGDGGPAAAASLSFPADVSVDRYGSVYVADSGAHRIRRVAADTGVISTVAGTGECLGPIHVDGMLATEASICMPGGVAVDSAGSLYIALPGSPGSRLLKSDAATGIVTTVAGNGSNGFSGDGGPATSASLNIPTAVAVDDSGDLFIADTVNRRVRKVDLTRGTISTVAGGGFSSEENVPATTAELLGPVGIAVDAKGVLYVSEREGSRVRRVAAGTGLISTVAGNGEQGFSGDGGPATAAAMNYPWGLAPDPAGNVFIAEKQNCRVRKVSAASGIIATFAGSGPCGQPSNIPLGDGGPATAATLRGPYGLALDVAGDLYIADSGNYSVRKVDARTGVISTIAKGLWGATGVALDASGNIFVADSFGGRIHRLDARSGDIGTVAGNGSSGYSGDGGPATAAGLASGTYSPYGIAVDPGGNLFIASGGDRVRAVFACPDRLGPFDSSYPGDGSAVRGGQFAAGWSKAASAFRYDVVVDTEFPPKKVVQHDVSGQGIRIAGLEPGRTYYWMVRAKGDPYCPPVDGTTGIRRFTTAAPCSPPPAPAVQPPSITGTGAAITFSPVPEAASYDVYLGAGSSPPLVASGLTATRYDATGLQPGTTYRCRVTAHASCNPDLVSSSPQATFAVPGSCVAPGSVEVTSPVAGAGGLASPLDLTWRAVSGASSYDVYVGAAADPPLLASGLTATALSVSLEPGKSYSLRVVAHAACDFTKTSTSSALSFATAAGSSCLTPTPPSGLASTKTSSFLGSTYTLSWPRIPGAALYRVDRTKAGESNAEAFTTSGASLLLTASEKTSYSHRVTALAACGAASLESSPLTVSVSPAPPALTITNPPRATVIRQPQPGLPLPRLEVELRNTGSSDFTGFFNTSQTAPFFITSEAALSLRAGEIRIFYLQFSGVPLGQPGVYDGLLALQSADPTDGTAFPQIAISLNVTALRSTDPIPSTTAPVFLQEGSSVDSVRFAPTPEGSQPPDILVDLKNVGTKALELAADVLPDSWISIADATSSSPWNATPLPGGGTRTLRLTAQRVRGASGGAFPRYTYLTVRTVDGKSSRLLIQDIGPTSAGPCPGRSVLAAGESSLLVPSLVNASAMGGGRYVSKLLITNLGPDVAQSDLYYTPDTGDPATRGFDCGKVLFASLLVPGLDVVAVTDPVRQLFGIAESSSGQLEIRSSRIGQLRVQSVVDAPAPGGGAFGFQLPTVKSGDGARPGVTHSAVGVVQHGTYRSNLILCETSGQPASVTVSLYDRTGAPLGSTQRTLPPYAKSQFSVAELSGGVDLPAGSLEIQANPGSAGSVVGMVTTIDGRTGDASAFLARPLKASTTSTVFTIASVAATSTFRSRVEIRNDDTRPVTYTLTYRGSTGTLTSQPRMLSPRAMDAWDSVLTELFNLAPGTYGPLQVSADSPNLTVVSRVYSETASGSYGDTLAGLALDDPSTTGNSNLTVLTDGLEGTTGNDRSRGARTNIIFTEITGKPVDLEVAIWEKSQRRVAPTGTLSVHLEPFEQRQINDIFGDDGFGIGQKDRMNVLCTVRPKAGSQGRVIALATRIDNLTNDTKNLVLVP